MARDAIRTAMPEQAGTTGEKAWLHCLPSSLPRFGTPEEIRQMAEPAESQPTAQDWKTTDSFLAVFSDIERLLKDRVSRRGNVKASDLIQEYLELNPYWARDHKDLEHFRQIRNFLTHERTHEHGFPVAVTPRSHARLVEIKRGLETAVAISRNHKKKVATIGPNTSLAEVLKTAFEKDFSQFPVVEAGGRFRGLVTENEITRWLGRHVARRGATVDLAGVAVSDILREKEPDRKLIPIFRFERLEGPEPEVMGLFIRHPMLEVVLLTASGTKTAPIEGIVTQWDAARYPAG